MGEDSAPRDGDAQRHIAGATTGALIAYVRRTRGDEAVMEVLRTAGDTRSPDELADATTWSSYEQAVALFDAAAVVLDDPDVGRQSGEELLRQYAGSEVAALLRSLGSPAEVLKSVTVTATKYSTVTVMEALEVTEGRVVVSAVTSPPIRRHRHLCRYTEGVLSQATPLFGLPPASVGELECQTRGDDRCLFVVSWDPAASADDDPASRCAFLEAELESLTARFGALQATAAELATAQTVDELLATVVRRAGLTVRSPRHLLAVRLAPAAPLRVHHSGFATDDEARSCAEALMAGKDATGGTGASLVVDIATVRHHFGYLAAMYNTAASFFPQERSLLEAYAGHAAAALEAASALEGAQRHSATARALLDLARSLGGLDAPDAVAERLAAATRVVVHCDQAAVFLWDREVEGLRLAAAEGLPPNVAEALAETTIVTSDTPVLAELLGDPVPRLLTAATADDFVSSLLRGAGVEGVAVVPIIRAGDFLGVVTAAFTDAARLIEPDDDLLERLSGMADHAATALQNSRLLQQVEAQALHDALTGLPNARLIEDRAAVAITNAKRDGNHMAVLFVDLDRFKWINDSFGHAAGDAVLVEVSRRMREVLRGGDTVGRLAGDEFVVVVSGIDNHSDVDAVVSKLDEALAAPYVVDGITLSASGSIGVATYPAAGADYSSLRREADRSMYEAKRRRRMPDRPTEARAGRPDPSRS